MRLNSASPELHNAPYELLKRDEIAATGGWCLNGGELFNVHPSTRLSDRPSALVTVPRLG